MSFRILGVLSFPLHFLTHTRSQSSVYFCGVWKTTSVGYWHHRLLHCEKKHPAVYQLSTSCLLYFIVAYTAIFASRFLPSSLPLTFVLLSSYCSWSTCSFSKSVAGPSCLCSRLSTMCWNSLTPTRFHQEIPHPFFSHLHREEEAFLQSTVVLLSPAHECCCFNHSYVLQLWTKEKGLVSGHSGERFVRTSVLQQCRTDESSAKYKSLVNRRR